MAAKLIQRFPIRTRTDICLAMLGMKSIESQIDIKKLTFLECLCNMPVHVLSKQIFNLRLAMYACRTNKITQRGYIPDIINILSKYNLLPVITRYSYTGQFPTKSAWKITCKKAVYQHHLNKWKQRLQNDASFTRFRCLHTSIEPAIIWTCASDFRSRRHALEVSKLWISPNPYDNRGPILCHACGVVVDNIVNHVVFYCHLSSDIRIRFYDIISNEFINDVSMCLTNCDDETKLQYLLGKRHHAFSSKKVHKHFLRIAISYVFKCLCVIKLHFQL